MRKSSDLSAEILFGNSFTLEVCCEGSSGTSVRPSGPKSCFIVKMESLAMASTSVYEKPVLRDCRVVLTRLSSSDILKWRRPNSDPGLRECRVVLNRLSSADILRWQIKDSASLELINPTGCRPDEQLLNERVLATRNMRASVPGWTLSSMEKVMYGHQGKIEELEREWNKNQSKMYQLEESIRVLKNTRCTPQIHAQHVYSNYSNTQQPNESANQTVQMEHQLEEYIRNVPRPITNDATQQTHACQMFQNTRDFFTYQNAHSTNVSNTRLTASTTQVSTKTSALSRTSKVEGLEKMRSGRKRNRRIDFGSTFFAESLPEQERSESNIVKKSRHSTDSSNLHVEQNVSHSAESSVPKVTPTCRLRVIPTQELIQRSTGLQAERNRVSEQSSAVPNSSFLSELPSVIKYPKQGGCVFCIERYKAMHGKRYCEKCLSKIKILLKMHRDGSDVLPQCNHALNHSVRGCDGCLAIFLRYVSQNGLSTSNEAKLFQDLTSYQAGNVPRFSRVPQPQRVLGTIDLTGQQLAAPPSTPIQNATSAAACNAVQNSTEGTKDSFLSRLLSGPVLNGSTNQTSVSSSKQPELVPSFSCPTEPSKKTDVSAFPSDWFLLVPNHVNYLPTPFFDSCYSCYELKSELLDNHCDSCWLKARKLKLAYLMDPKTPNPQCHHPLNLPMKGCDACILRAFIVRYNHRFPDACFPVPLNRLESNQKFGLTSGFPENWFSELPSDPCELPTPRTDHCLSCYEPRRTLHGHCMTCVMSAKVMEETYNEDPDAPLPLCIHPLNRPMRGCHACILRAYILSYNKCNPDKPYTIPYEKVGAEYFLQRCSGCVSESSKRGEEAPRTLRLKPKKGNKMTLFPSDWFICVSKNPLIFPVHRCGCCAACYENKTTTLYCDRTGLNIGGHCSDCSRKAEILILAYQSGELSIPKCSHLLSKPIRGCQACIVRTLIVRHNRNNPLRPFPVPFKSVSNPKFSERCQ